MNRWEFVPKMQSRNITLYAHLVTWNYTLRPFGLPIKKIKLGDVQKPQDQKDENDYKRWFVPQKNPKPKFICTQKNRTPKIFYPTISGVGWNHPLTLFTQIPTPPKRLSPHEVVIRWWTSWDPRWYPNKNPWDQRIRSSADRSGGGNSNTYIHGVIWCIYIYTWIYGALSYFFTPIFFGGRF